MKTLPTLLASLSLISGMVSCVGPMPGDHVNLHAPFPGLQPQYASPIMPLNVNPRVTHLGSANAARFATPVSMNPRLTNPFSQTIARPTTRLAVNPRVLNATGSDYQPHLANEYRNGWRAGSQDAAYGAGRDYRRAYAYQGSGWESYFQEGYNDGYEGRPMAH